MEQKQNEWFVSSSELDGQEVITKGRRFLQSVKNSHRFNERIEIEWSYKPMSNGMPTDEQDKFMNDVAFELKKAMEDVDNSYLTALYIGRAVFYMIFYTSSVDTFSEILHNVLSKYEQLPLQIGLTEDKEWQDYSEMLKLSGFNE